MFTTSRIRTALAVLLLMFGAFALSMAPASAQVEPPEEDYDEGDYDEGDYDEGDYDEGDTGGGGSTAPPPDSGGVGGGTLARTGSDGTMMAFMVGGALVVAALGTRQLLRDRV